MALLKSPRVTTNGWRLCFPNLSVTVSSENPIMLRRMSFLGVVHNFNHEALYQLPVFTSPSGVSSGGSKNGSSLFNNRFSSLIKSLFSNSDTRDEVNGNLVTDTILLLPRVREVDEGRSAEGPMG